MKKLFRFAGSAILVYILLGFFINLLNLASKAVTNCPEETITYSGSNNKHHYRSWMLIEKHEQFCTNYLSQNQISQSRAAERELIAKMDLDYTNYWGSIYRHLVRQNRDYLHDITDSLSRLGQQANLDRRTFAELIVSFVQDIPYSFVMSGSCDGKKGHPCVPNQSFGILSPYEFLHTLSGDCDTRAVLLYAILSDLGFDPMIVVSNEYAHAMLALNIPATGDHLTHRRNKYYFWETTAKGWPLGMLPPDCNNVEYWDIALVKNEQ